MAEKIKLEVLTPAGAKLAVDVEEAYIPGTEGEFGVVNGHSNLISPIKVGEVYYKTEGADVTGRLAVTRGYAEVSAEKVTVLVDLAFDAEDVDLNEAKSDEASAQEKLNTLTHHDEEFQGVEDELLLAQAKIALKSE